VVRAARDFAEHRREQLAGGGVPAESTLLFHRQLLTVEIAYENEDDFVKNLSTIRAEERIASAVPVPAGLLKGTFTTP